MNSVFRCVLFMTLFAGLLVARPSAAETWKIITLDWPPYTDEKAAEKGAAAKALKEALKTVGVKVEYVFMPWSRGVYEVNKKQYAGIFPVWNHGPRKTGKLSPAIFQSPIGFVYNRDKVISWKSLKDFKGLNIGVVQSYEYPDEIAALGKQGFFHLQSETTDEQNLHKIAYKRIDLTIVDLVNARYLTEVRHPKLKSRLVFDSKIYVNAPLYISLKDDKTYPKKIKKLNEAFKNIDTQKIIDEYLTQTFK